MDTRHIKAAKLMSVKEIFEADAFEFPDDDKWGIQFEVSEEFKKALFAHFEQTLHGMHIYRMMSLAEGAECGLSEDETRATWLYIYGDQSWSITDQGNLMMQVTYEDFFDKEIPDTAWCMPVALLKAVLRSMK